MDEVTPNVQYMYKNLNHKDGKWMLSVIDVFLIHYTSVWENVWLMNEDLSNLNYKVVNHSQI